MLVASLRAGLQAAQEQVEEMRRLKNKQEDEHEALLQVLHQADNKRFNAILVRILFYFVPIPPSAQFFIANGPTSGLRQVGHCKAYKLHALDFVRAAHGVAPSPGKAAFDGNDESCPAEAGTILGSACKGVEEGVSSYVL